jgi:hypothetical protein
MGVLTADPLESFFGGIALLHRLDYEGPHSKAALRAGST